MGNFEFNTYCLPSALAAAVVLPSFYIALKNLKAGRRAWVLSFLLSQLFFCMICESLLIASATPEQTLFWDRMMYIPIIFIPSTLIHMMMHYLPGQKPKLWVYIPAVVFAGLAHTDLLLTGVEQTYWGWGKVVGPIYPAFKFYFGSFALCFYISLCYAILSEKSARLKNELLCLAAGTIPTVFIGMLIVLVLPMLGITSGNIIINALCVIYLSLVLSYSILSKRLFDLYSALPVIGAQRQMEKRRIKESIEQLVLNGDPLSWETIINKINAAFNVDVYIETGDSVFTNKESSSQFSIRHCLNFADSPNNLIVRHELPMRSAEHLMLLQHGIDMIIPLYIGQKLLAVIYLGIGISDQLYSRGDMGLLMRLCNQLKIAIHYLRHTQNLLNPELNKASVIVYKAEGEIYSVKKKGYVNVAIVDYDHNDIKIKL